MKHNIMNLFKIKAGKIRKPALILSATLMGFPMFSQIKEGVIMTVDGEEIPTEEFLYLYHKNNNQQSQTQSLEEYLPLFEVYRLKVAEAKQLGKDTTASFRKEMAQYKRELLEPYIEDTVFINQLVDIAAERERTDVESSHIMFIKTHNMEKDKRNYQMLDSIRGEIIAGGDFISLARQYSQDKFSSEKGGYLGFNPSGTFPYSFETAVYETPEGDISEIVESHVGYHIVKSGARRPSANKERSRDQIKADVLRLAAMPFDSRYQEIRENNFKTIKARHPETDITGLSQDEAYKVLIGVEEDYQYSNNPAYRNLVDEYINGSLLYEVSVDNIWNKAANDTDDLKNYYEPRKEKYKWEAPHAKGYLVKALNDSVAGLVREKIGVMPTDSVIKYVTTDLKKKAVVEKFNMAQGGNPIIDRLIFGIENTKPVKGNINNYIVLESRIVSQPEDLEDVKSAVINDYQEVLEQQWLNDLRARHSIVINEEEWSKINAK